MSVYDGDTHSDGDEIVETDFECRFVSVRNTADGVEHVQRILNTIELLFESSFGGHGYTRIVDLRAHRKTGTMGSKTKRSEPFLKGTKREKFLY